jgi:hypothetical protein
VPRPCWISPCRRMADTNGFFVVARRRLRSKRTNWNALAATCQHASRYHRPIGLVRPAPAWEMPALANSVRRPGIGRTPRHLHRPRTREHGVRSIFDDLMRWTSCQDRFLGRWTVLLAVGHLMDRSPRNGSRANRNGDRSDACSAGVPLREFPSASLSSKSDGRFQRYTGCPAESSQILPSYYKPATGS